MLLTNPLTTTVLLETGLGHGHRAFVQNAAAGAIGKMMVRTCAQRGVALVNVVRRAEQAVALRGIGAEHVVIAGEPGAPEALRALCERLGVTCGFDAVAGDGTDQLARAIGIDGRILVYGMLSGAPCRIDTDTLVFRRLHVDGFTMYAWLEQTSLLGKLRTLAAAQKRLADDLRSEIRATRPLREFADALAMARGTTSDGKVLFARRSE
jgi:NADPH:quinone reductase-like Zn-dependent oxidoreductase